MAVEPVSEEERARVRSEVRDKLAAASARHTPQYWARLREQLGLPSCSSRSTDVRFQHLTVAQPMNAEGSLSPARPQT